MKDHLRIVITSGDVNGIGLEVASKALHHLSPQKGIQFYLWRGQTGASHHLARLDRQFKRKTVSSWPEAMATTPDFNKTLIDIASPLPPALWVEMMAQSAFNKTIDALVTGPLSKTGIVEAGLKDNGHTGILKRIAKADAVFMSFLGEKLNVTLATGHCSLGQAYQELNQNTLELACRLTLAMVANLRKRLVNLPVGLVAMNPHAGEEGLIDDKEQLVFQPIITKLHKEQFNIVGPLVPDVCFQEKQRKSFSYFVSPYHDQGLIPFKMLHGAHNGIQVSLGLPFIRTSVNHGTANDLFGKNCADYGSMKNAIKIAIRLLLNKPIKW